MQPEFQVQYIKKSKYLNLRYSLHCSLLECFFFFQKPQECSLSSLLERANSSCVYFEALLLFKG